jgi:hypothetical protein
VRAGSGVTVCGTYVFARVGDELSLRSPRLSERAYAVEEIDPDTLVLRWEHEQLTMSRLAGAGPVAECVTGAATLVAALPTRPGSWSNLNGVDDVLYFNRAGNTAPIAGYSLGEDALGQDRTYTVSAGGGIDRHVVAARSHRVFYGHCACGGSNRLGMFDLDDDLLIAQVNTSTDLDTAISVRYGFYDDGELVIGGAGGGASNRLLSLDPDTLALVEQRTVLQGVSIQDLTRHGGALLALLHGPAIVEIGANGMAVRTITVPSFYGLSPIGLSSTASGLYAALGDSSTDTTYIFAVELP